MPVYSSAPPKLLRVEPSPIDCVMVPVVPAVQEVGRMPVPGVPAAVMSAGTTAVESTTVPTTVTFAPTTAQAELIAATLNTGIPSAVRTSESQELDGSEM